MKIAPTTLAFLLAISLAACSSDTDKAAQTDAATTTEQTADNAAPQEASAAMTQEEKLKDFYTRLRQAMIADDRRTMEELSYFPFNLQDQFIPRSQFGDLQLSDDIKNTLRNTDKVEKTRFTYSPPEQVAYNTGQLWEVNLGGPGLYIAMVNGEFKMVAFYYGE